MVGLGIFVDLSWSDAFDPSIVVSPPMLAPRRSPLRLQLVDSPNTESAPMQTPSPSLRGPLSDRSSSATSSGERSEALPHAAGLGINILGTGAVELALSLHENMCYPTATGVGLGLNLPCLEDAELITKLELQSTSQLGVPIDLSFLEDDTLDAPDALGPEPVGQPVPSRGYHSLGFELNELDHASPVQESPTLEIGRAHV